MDSPQSMVPCAPASRTRGIPTSGLEALGALRRQGKLEEALTVVLRLLGEVDACQTPGVAAYLWCQRAGILETLSRFEEAAAAATNSRRLITAARQNAAAGFLLQVHVGILQQAGRLERILGRYIEAESLLRQALDLIEGSAELSDWQQQPLLLNEFGMLYKYWARFEEGERAYRLALQLLAERGSRGDSPLDEQDELRASLLHNLGGLEHARGRFHDAQAWARQSLDLHLHIYGDDAPETVADAAALGGILHGLGRYQEAIPLFERAIQFFSKLFGETHYEVAVNLNNLAAAWQQLGRYDEAEAAFRRCIDIKRRLLGDDHPDEAISLGNLANLLIASGETVESRTLLERALTIFELRCGSDHPASQRIRKTLRGILDVGPT